MSPKNPDIVRKQAAVRIVMVGRYSLSNSRYQRMFQQSEISKSERQLDKFNQEETKAYLNEIGITKPGDINRFWKATKGYPMGANHFCKNKNIIELKDYHSDKHIDVLILVKRFLDSIAPQKFLIDDQFV